MQPMLLARATDDRYLPRKFCYDYKNQYHYTTTAAATTMSATMTISAIATATAMT